MSDRISTMGLYHQGLSALLQRQSELARTQLQMSSGSKLLSAADDPVAAGLGVMLDRANAKLTQYGSNATLVSSHLNLEENALVSVGDRLQRISELAIEASNDTQSTESRAAIAAELKQQYDGLVAAANSGDGTGRYLFGGSQNATPPFAVAAGGVAYSGDQVQKQVDIGTSTSVADADPGSNVFMAIRTGNGTFAARAAAGNSGTAILTAASVTDSSQWDNGSYRVSFDGAGNYQVLDASNAVIGSGAYTPGSAIAFRGVSLSVDVQPAAGDQFTVAPPANQDIFATVKSLIDTVSAPSSTPAQRAAQRNGFFASIEDIGKVQDHIVGVRASVGARLSTIDNTADERSAQGLSLQTTLAGIRDLDYTEAATRLSQQQLALQAAQQTFMRVQGSSLFDLLR